jgi:hypothetical protein
LCRHGRKEKERDRVTGPRGERGRERKRKKEKKRKKKRESVDFGIK